MDDEPEGEQNQQETGFTNPKSKFNYNNQATAEVVIENDDSKDEEDGEFE